MKMPANYNDVQVSEHTPQPEAGGYILYCMKAEETTSKAGNDMLVLDFDIMTGDHKGYYSRLMKKQDFKRWLLQNFLLLNDERAIGRYKGVLDSFKKSNTNFPDASFAGVEHDTSKLVGLRIGAVLRKEEYLKNDGTIGTNLKIFYLTSVDRIEKNDFKIPDIKKLDTGFDTPPTTDNNLPQTSAPMPEDDSLPF